MKKQLLLSLLGVGLVLGACSDDKDPVVYPNDGNLSITTSIFSNVNNYAFANNEKIGLRMKRVNGIKQIRIAM